MKIEGKEGREGCEGKERKRRKGETQCATRLDKGRTVEFRKMLGGTINLSVA